MRRFAQPARDDAWSGSDFSFADVTLRKSEHEAHELLAQTTMSGCLNVIQGIKRNKYTQKTNIKTDCSMNGKAVYQLNSTVKNTNWWYD